jgi:glycosyltransferase involved in cell wall biosynthesis
MLARALRSIAEQTYAGGVECVVVFDQSKPEAVDARESTRLNIRVCVNSRSPGLAGARNSGALASSGSVIAFCDDDDVWQRNKLNQQIAKMQACSAEVVASGVRINYGNRVVARRAPSSVEFRDLIRSRVTAVHPSTFVIRRSALEDMGLVDEGIPGSYGEDYDLLLRAARRAPIVAVEQPLVDVHWHNASFFADSWTTRVRALEYLMNKHPELKEDRRGYARLEGRIAFAEAALRHRRAALVSSWRSMRNNPLERRAYLAAAVASGVITADSVMRMANQRGRGL